MPRNPWWAVSAGLCATLVGVGLQRFAYSALIPPLIDAGWFTPSQASYLWFANAAGYLLGGLMAAPLSQRIAPPRLVKASMVLAVAGFIACAFPLSFDWYFAWRILSGVTGGLLMTVPPLLVSQILPARHFGIASGIVFSGVGWGVIASATLIPAALPSGIAQVWFLLAGIAALLTLVAWRQWPDVGVPARETAPALSDRRARISLTGLYFTFALAAAALTPHMIFSVDLIARQLHHGSATGGLYWACFGVAAMAGPMIAGALADRFGSRTVLHGGWTMGVIVIALPVLSQSLPALFVSGICAGSLVTGLVPLTVARARELAGASRALQNAAIAACTAAFAIGQAIAAFGFSAVADGTAETTLRALLIGAGCFVAAIIVERVAEFMARRSS